MPLGQSEPERSNARLLAAKQYKDLSKAISGKHVLYNTRTAVYRPALVLALQDDPVYLRTRSDRFVYRSALSLSVVGLCVTAYSLYRMATASIPAKTQD